MGNNLISYLFVKIWLFFFKHYCFTYQYILLSINCKSSMRVICNNAYRRLSGHFDANWAPLERADVQVPPAAPRPARRCLHRRPVSFCQPVSMETLPSYRMETHFPSVDDPVVTTCVHVASGPADLDPLPPLVRHRQRSKSVQTLDSDPRDVSQSIL